MTGSDFFERPRFVIRGMRDVAETAGAYWLLDQIALAQRFETRGAREFDVMGLMRHTKLMYQLEQSAQIKKGKR
jgi:hypothetical protein